MKTKVAQVTKADLQHAWIKKGFNCRHGRWVIYFSGPKWNKLEKFPGCTCKSWLTGNGAGFDIYIEDDYYDIPEGLL